MKKTKVVIASVLKPIDDTRMFEKLGLSMAKTNKYEVNIIGFTSKNTVNHESINFEAHGPFNRTSWARLQCKWKVYRNYLKVKPKIIICNTHELLIVTILYRILFGAKIVYDIRENYFKNIKETNVFHPVIKPLLAIYVRSKEWFAKPFFNGFIMAERIYQQQLSFIPESKLVVIENKFISQYQSEPQRQVNGNPITLLYSGTISDSNGVFEAIDIAEKLHVIDNSVKLKIVGYCALKRDLKRLQEAVQAKEYIELIGGDYLVPHSQIVEEISKAHFGLVLKKPNNGMNDDKILTRLFEYTANQLPIILLNNPTWVQFCEEFNAAIAVDPLGFDAQKLLHQIRHNQFYTKGSPLNSRWETEETKFLDFIEKLT